MRRYPRPAAIAALLCCLPLTACGGSRHHAPPRPAPTIKQHCASPETAMNCVLQHQPSPRTFGVTPHAATDTQTVKGVDFAWSCPSPSGWTFGASYLSPDATKNWTRGCVNAWHARGARTVAVWEATANRAEQGFQAGFQDAYTARGQARYLGEPDSRPIDYAVDCDCPLANITGYFQGVDAGTAADLHLNHTAAVERVGVYGGYSQVGGLHARGLVGHTNWQTYAWSYSAWQPASIAPLEQYLNSNAVDYDRAIAVDYGQWPYTTPAPRVDRYRVLPAGKVHTDRGRLSERASVQAYDRSHCSRHTNRDGRCFHYRRELQALERHLYAVAHDGKQLGEFDLPPDWTTRHRGERYHSMRLRSQHR